MSIRSMFAAIPALMLGVLLPIGLAVALQVWLCRKGKYLGLILPGLSLLLSIVMVLSMSTFSSVGSGSIQVRDEHGNIIQEEHHQGHTSMPHGAVAAVGSTFLVSNIPTVVFGGIWLSYRNRREWKDDLKKMKIEDLE